MRKGAGYGPFQKEKIKILFESFKICSKLSGSLNSCSINALRARLTSGGLSTDYDVLIGRKSMGYFLEKEGFASLPGPTIPTPGSDLL